MNSEIFFHMSIAQNFVKLFNGSREETFCRLKGNEYKNF